MSRMRRPSLCVTVLDQTADFGILVPSVGVVAAAAEKRIQTLLFYFILFYFFAASSSYVSIVSKASPRAIESTAHLRINGPPQHPCPGRAPPHLSSAPLTFVVLGLFFFFFFSTETARRVGSPQPRWPWMNEWNMRPGFPLRCCCPSCWLLFMIYDPARTPLRPAEVFMWAYWICDRRTNQPTTS